MDEYDVEYLREMVKWQHGIDRYADAKRTAYEVILHLLTKESIIFDGNNSRGGYVGDLSKLELMARKIVHEDFMINCADQVQITVEVAGLWLMASYS